MQCSMCAGLSTIFPITLLLCSVIHYSLQSACNRHIISPVPTSGTIESPSFPSPYSSNINCIYNISSAPSTVIHLTFLSFDLHEKNQKSHQCLDAYIVIIVKDRQGKEHVGERLCGSRMTRKLETMQNSVQIQFASTVEGGKHRGFRIQYDIISEAAILEPTSYMVPGDRRVTSQYPCGGRSQAGQLTGEIMSPGYPFTLPANASCNWLIRVEPRQKIYVKLVHFHISNTIAECDKVSLSLIDGYKHENGKKESLSEGMDIRFCGNQNYYIDDGMKSLITTGNRLLIKFVSTAPPSADLEGHRLGFKLVWTAVEGFSAALSDLSSKQTISRSAESTAAPTCDQFICKGGQICVEQGHGECISRPQLCIHSSLVCNGINNCVEGDFSDEQHCYSNEILAASTVGFISVVFLILLCICCDKIKKKRRLRNLIRQRRTENGKGSNSLRHTQLHQPLNAMRH